MKSLATQAKRFLREEEGVTMVEYGLLAALISIVVLLAVTHIGQNLKVAFLAICNALAGAVTGGVAC